MEFQVSVRIRFLAAVAALAAVTITNLSVTAFAGGVDGGGGQGVVCRDSYGNILSAEILDLYEARIQYSVVPLPSQADIEFQVAEALSRLGSGREIGFAKTLQTITDNVRTSMVLLPDGTGLVLVDDANNVITPNGCAIEQVANYTGQNQVIVNGQIWRALDETNKAALIVHEALYKVFRMYGATNSVRARKSVGLAFAGAESVPIKIDLPPDTYECYTPHATFPGSRFFAYNDAEGQLIFQFDMLEGHLMLTHSTVTLDRVPVSNMRSRDVTYWLAIDSVFDMGGLNVAVSFQRQNDNSNGSMKIGIGSMPYMPSTDFECARYSGDS